LQKYLFYCFSYSAGILNFFNRAPLDTNPCSSRLTYCNIEQIIGSVAERVKAPFLRRPSDHDSVINSRFNSHPRCTHCCVLR